MREWLESVVKKVADEPHDGHGRRLVAAATIAYCFHQLLIPYPNIDKFTVPLLNMLQLEPNVVDKTCPDYDLLCNLLPSELRCGIKDVNSSF